MGLKISSWLWGDNKHEEFWSMLKDERERKLWSHQLYQSRASLRWAIVFPIIVLLIDIVAKSTGSSAFVLFLLVMGMIYIDTESKIRIIRLYELLSATDKKL